MAVNLHLVQDHLGLRVEGLTAVRAQIFLKHFPAVLVGCWGVDSRTGDAGSGFLSGDAGVVTGLRADCVGGGTGHWGVITGAI